MDHRDTQNALAQHLARVRMVHFAFGASALLYVGAAWMLINRFGFTGVMEIPFAVAVGITVAQLPVIFLGYFIPSRMLRSTAGTGTTSATNTHAMLQRHMQSTVVAAALRETAVVAALVLTLLTGDIKWVAIIASMATISMIVHWPKHDGVENFMMQQRLGG